MARLIRTEKEVEGRYTSVGRRRGGRARPVAGRGRGEVVGRPAPRQDGHERARGEAQLHGRHPASGDAARGGAALPARARAREATSTSARALERARRARRDRPGRRATCSQRRAGFQGAAGRRRRRRDARAGPRGARARSRSSGRSSSRCSTRTRRSRAEVARRASRAATSAATSSAAFAEADVVVEAEYRTQTRPAQLDGDAPVGLRAGSGDTLDVYISTQFIWGVRDEVAEQLGLPPDHVRVVCELHGRRLRREERRPATTRSSRPSSRRRTGRPGALRAHAARGEPRDRQPQRDDPAAARRRARRRDADRARAAST